MKTKEYLGDSVYAEFTDFGTLMLTTDNGNGPSNVIYLEPETYLALEDFVERVGFSDSESQDT
jgi:hypothetical protein